MRRTNAWKRAENASRENKRTKWEDYRCPLYRTCTYRCPVSASPVDFSSLRDGPAKERINLANVEARQPLQIRTSTLEALTVAQWLVHSRSKQFENTSFSPRYPITLRPVTMETRCFHKKLDFQRYPPKDFCTARYERKSSKKKFQTFQKPRKK